ncbi:MAG: HlyD family efflux transporter periplasmic adaptor subunit [Desulfovibrionaceae bacterium]
MRKQMTPRLFPVLALLLALLGGCTGESDLLQGYVEGEYVLVAAPLSGRLETLHVRRGQEVQAGQALFDLESAFEAAAVSEAEQNLLRAELTLTDKSKGGRPSELASIRAQLGEAQSSFNFARTDYERKKRLFQEQTISADELDRSRTEYNRTLQAVSRIKAELDTAKLGGRSDALAAAEAEVEGARAKLEQARWNLNQKTLAAPKSGLIFDTLFEPGEWVAAGCPVVSLLPPENRKVIFFVPETRVGNLRPGQTVLASFDGAETPIPARITYISPEAEYTPPVIYSSENRAKLVFLVEARPTPDAAPGLRPGQPVDVRLEKAGQ